MNTLLRSQGLYFAANKVFLPPIFTPNSYTNPVCLQCVRWRKKPRWLPIAKTKLFRIPTRKVHPPDENAEVLRLFNDYRTRMKAIRYYLSEKTKSLTTAPEVIAEQQRLLEEEHAKCFKLNDEWNMEVAKVREKRVADEAERKRLEVLEEVENFKKRESEEIELINRMIRLEMENSKTFITPENIDAAIEKALNETVDYNYCIDLDGNIYKGLHARPGITEPENKGSKGDDNSSIKQAVN